MKALRIKELAKEKGITLRELADKIGVSQNSISGLATGKQKPSFDTLEKLADALDVEIGDLFAPSKVAKIVCPLCGGTIALSADKA